MFSNIVAQAEPRHAARPGKTAMIFEGDASAWGGDVQQAIDGLEWDLNSAQRDRPERRDQIFVKLCPHIREYGVGVTRRHS